MSFRDKSMTSQAVLLKATISRMIAQCTSLIYNKDKTPKFKRFTKLHVGDNNYNIIIIIAGCNQLLLTNNASTQVPVPLLPSHKMVEKSVWVSGTLKDLAICLASAECY